MQITITIEQITKAGGSCSGVELFKKVHGDSWTVEWTREAQIELIKSELRRHFGWAVAVGLLPVWSLRGSDLRGIDLRGSNLRGSNLSGSNLRGSDLSWSDLRWSNLSGSDLRWSNLSGSDLSGSDLSGSDLSGAKALVAPEGWELVNGVLRPMETKVESEASV